MALLDTATVRDRLEALPGWHFEEDAIHKEFAFDDFVSAVDFVKRLTEVAEEKEHHPDLEVSWGRVVVHLSTHSAGGVTEKDLEMARAVEKL